MNDSEVVKELDSWVVELQKNLREAITLLERCAGPELVDSLTRAVTIQRFLASRAPAQPAQAWHVRGATVELGPAQPTASDFSLPDSADGNVWAYQFCKRNPAVDEATMRLWFIAAVNAGLKAGRVELTAPEPSAHCGDPMCDFEDCGVAYEPYSIDAWKARCNDAEAQLAAVRGYMFSTLADSTYALKGLAAQRVREIVMGVAPGTSNEDMRALLTAPSPGAGEKT